MSLSRDGLSAEQFKLLFGVRRSVLYHERRNSFFSDCHRVTNFLTILMAGSALFDLAKEGPTAWWLAAVSIIAALFAVTDMVCGFSRSADRHGRLRERFADLEMRMLSGDALDATWKQYERDRLTIERDEPPIYIALDWLCRNELLTAWGYTKPEDEKHFAKVSKWQQVTSNIFRWQNLASGS